MNEGNVSARRRKLLKRRAKKRRDDQLPNFADLNVGSTPSTDSDNACEMKQPDSPDLDRCPGNPSVGVDYADSASASGWQCSRSASLRMRRQENKLARATAIVSRDLDDVQGATSLNLYLASAELLQVQFVLTSVDELEQCTGASVNQHVNNYGGCGCHPKQHKTVYAVMMYSYGYTAIWLEYVFVASVCGCAEEMGFGLPSLNW